MSGHSLRHDPICQNCGDTVQKRFCSNCGQENTETRQSFGYLIRHFIEDLTHYDSSFWLTMRYLLFRPGFLTVEYLKGRRNSFVPPVRLYIFISFATFLLAFLLPDKSHPESTKPHPLKSEDTSAIYEKLKNRNANKELEILKSYTSERQLDSVQKLLPESERLDPMSRLFARNVIHLRNDRQGEFKAKFLSSFEHNFSKSLFVYMPLFALVLWLFHGKKRWLFFDHAIFTLHYFSFLLLVSNLISICSLLFFLSAETLLTLKSLLLSVLTLAIFLYFLLAHKQMYGERWVVSILKSLIIYGINLIIFLGVFVVFALINLLLIH